MDYRSGDPLVKCVDGNGTRACFIALIPSRSLAKDVYEPLALPKIDPGCKPVSAFQAIDFSCAVKPAEPEEALAAISPVSLLCSFVIHQSRDSAMTIESIKTLDSEHWIRIGGQLTVGDFHKLQRLGESSLERFGRFRILIELDGFQGWSREPGWEDTFFLSEDELQRVRIAMVGDEKWKDDALMFMGKPIRKTAIEFFPASRLAEAKVWLAEGSVQSLFLE